MTAQTLRNLRILGVPLDLGAGHRGVDMGPSALRIAGLAQGLRDLGHQVAREEDVTAPQPETREFGKGEARFLAEIQEVCSRLAERTQLLVREGLTPVVLGGDHSLAMGSAAGTAAALAEQGSRCGLLWFDAHGDINTPSTSPSGNIHGMPLAHLLGHGEPALVDIGGAGASFRPEQVALVGIRDLDAAEQRLLSESGVRTFSMRDIDDRGMADVAREALDVVTSGTAGFHLSFDADGLDPSVAPGVGTPVPGGVSYREAHLLMEMIAETGELLSMDLAETNPILDVRNETAERLVHLTWSAFGQRIL